VIFWLQFSAYWRSNLSRNSYSTVTLGLLLTVCVFAPSSVDISRLIRVRSGLKFLSNRFFPRRGCAGSNASYGSMYSWLRCMAILSIVVTSAFLRGGKEKSLLRSLLGSPNAVSDRLSSWPARMFFARRWSKVSFSLIDRLTDLEIRHKIESNLRYHFLFLFTNLLVPPFMHLVLISNKPLWLTPPKLIRLRWRGRFFRSFGRLATRFFRNNRHSVPKTFIYTI